MKTTLNAIRAHSPCSNGWAKLLKNLGKTQADDEPLAITTILESNGLDDALWCLRAVIGHDREIRLLAVAYARSVQHLMTDTRSISALDVAERYAYGQATRDELNAAKAAAEAAAEAAWDAWAAAKAAAAAANEAAWDAWDAAEAAAEAAARDAADAADAARAAWAARDAAVAAARAARDAAADAAWAAAAAARDAARAAWAEQANLLILACNGCFELNAA
jgi:hypothetical protein